ncbi:hypothetical protein A2U01_0074757, partial [Trifolium medium]|nr:hypothetical protein [Trifolium medium]
MRDLIEDLIKSGHLRKFLEDAAKGHIALPKQERYLPKKESEEASKSDKSRVVVNTIAGGFLGGGESNAARKRYVRRSTLEVQSVGHQTFPSVPDIS